MTSKTALERLLDFAANLVAMGIPSIPFVLLVRLEDEDFRILLQGIGLQEFRILMVLACAVWLTAFILLHRLFERLLDRLFDRPRSPWLKT